MVTFFEIGKVIQSAIGNDTFWLTWILTLLILVYELSSAIENIVIINPDMVFLKRFSGLFENIVDRQMDNVEEKLNSTTDTTSSASDTETQKTIPQGESTGLQISAEVEESEG